MELLTEEQLIELEKQLIAVRDSHYRILSKSQA
jgi:hypothetical protein